MSATLAQSIAWDRMTPAQKQAAATVLAPEREYQVTGEWGTAMVRCLDAATKQFRVLTVRYRSSPHLEMDAGYNAILSPETLATLKPRADVAALSYHETA